MIYAIYDYSDDSNAFIESLHVFDIKKYMASKYGAELFVERKNEKVFASARDTYLVVSSEPGDYFITRHERVANDFYCIDIHRVMHDELGADYHATCEDGLMIFKCGETEYAVSKED